MKNAGKTRTPECEFERAPDARAPGTEWEKLIRRLIGRKILALKCVRDHIRDDNGDVLVALPDSYLDAKMRLDWFEIVAVGEGCKDFAQEEVGRLIHGPVWADGMHRLVDYELHKPSDYFILDEKLIGDGGKTTVIKPFTLSKGA